MQIRAHRLMWEMTFGPIHAGLFVCHSCDTPGCVNPRHLFVGTALDNTHDMVRKGRSASSAGETNGAAKLSCQQVREIVKLAHGAGWGLHKAIAKRFGISPGYVSAIKNGRTWSWLTKTITS